MKVIKALLLSLWFIASIGFMFYILFNEWLAPLISVAFISAGIALSFILSDEDLVNMDLW